MGATWGDLWQRRAGSALVAVGFALLALCVGAPAASATQTTVDCAPGNSTDATNLQNALNALYGGNDDTLIIDGMCSGAFTLPSPDYYSYTIEGESGTVSGFDGDNVQQGGPLLSGQIQGGSATTTLEGLTFENAVAPSGGGSSALSVQVDEGDVTLDDDTFQHNGSSNAPPVAITEDADGNPCTTPNGNLTIASSTFTNQTLDVTNETFGNLATGAGLGLFLECSTDPVSLTNNTFTDDTLDASSSDGVGGGLSLYGADEDPVPVTQRGNVFDSDVVNASGTLKDYGGAGEWDDGVDVHSTGDRFTHNTLPGTTGSNWSWGAGLSIVNTCVVESNSHLATASTLADDAVAANTIADSGGDLAGDAQGAGIYLGCSPIADPSHNNLTLEDSTVTGNAVTPSASGAVAGIYGDTYDTLTLENSILYGDSGGAETDGFTGTGSSLTAAYSDFCGGSSPYAGAGNICANPQLGGTLGAQETAASPTIDAGSPALVPNGLTTDFFDNPREDNGTVGCATLAATVDIGAAEYYNPPPCPAAQTTPAALTTPEPTITDPTQTHTKWTDGSAQATISRKHKKPKLPVGTTLGFTLNEQATVTLTFTERVSGRNVHGTCVAQTKKNRKHHGSCTLTKAAGTLTFAGQAGADSVTFDGLLQNGTKLGPGSYTVAIGATTAGETATPATLSFTIAKS
ncbi:MAG: hypothetical protein ABSG64_12275 [Solirubrobacteraceae bacterium]|jgi:hypothetical protein